jgi:hypothetical protein
MHAHTHVAVMTEPAAETPYAKSGAAREWPKHRSMWYDKVLFHELNTHVSASNIGTADSQACTGSNLFVVPGIMMPVKRNITFRCGVLLYAMLNHARSRTHTLMLAPRSCICICRLRFRFLLNNPVTDGHTIREDQSNLYGEFKAAIKRIHAHTLSCTASRWTASLTIGAHTRTCS